MQPRASLLEGARGQLQQRDAQVCNLLTAFLALHAAQQHSTAHCSQLADKKTVNLVSKVVPMARDAR
jgi:hypothetical protein